VNDEYSWTNLGTLLIHSVNLTFAPTQYHKETCDSCMHGLAIWVCAEDLNPTWWGQQSQSAASFIGKGICLLFYMWTSLIIAYCIAF